MLFHMLCSFDAIVFCIPHTAVLIGYLVGVGLVSVISVRWGVGSMYCFVYVSLMCRVWAGSDMGH